jgi:hypothetical protein
MLLSYGEAGGQFGIVKTFKRPMTGFVRGELSSGSDPSSCKQTTGWQLAQARTP